MFGILNQHAVFTDICVVTFGGQDQRGHHLRQGKCVSTGIFDNEVFQGWLFKSQNDFLCLTYYLQNKSNLSMAQDDSLVFCH